ncbi:MAG: hypothetical protein OXT74_06940, partial [Candidatus Poribacteria bacterium]|nr:hypothetical protein [Candidatus Poribacteria bacterium]
ADAIAVLNDDRLTYQMTMNERIFLMNTQYPILRNKAKYEGIVFICDIRKIRGNPRFRQHEQYQLKERSNNLNHCCTY